MSEVEMKVALVGMTRFGELYPEDVIERAASVCYDSNPDFENHKIMKGCIKSGHLSVLEHANFTFYIYGVSRALLAQLSRHRHISLSVRSQRYCDESNMNYVVTDGIERYTTSKQMFEAAMRSTSFQYDTLKEYGLDNEDARMILPNACATELYMTCNARALIEMSHLRLCTRAQDEIRQMFRLIKTEVTKYAPTIGDMMRPKCMADEKHPFCTERKSCGLSPKLDDVYDSTRTKK